MLAAPADRHQRHLRAHQLAKRSNGAGLPRVSIAGAHLVWGLHRHDRLMRGGEPPAIFAPPGGKRGEGSQSIASGIDQVYQ